MKVYLFLSILCYTIYGQHYIPVKKISPNYKEQKGKATGYLLSPTRL